MRFTAKRIALLLFAVTFGIFGILIVVAVQEDNERADKIAVTNDPGDLARLIINSSDASLIAAREGRTLKIKYKIDPWALTKGTMKSTFERQTKEIVPAIFDRFPDIDDIQITVDAQFQTIRGDEYRSPILRIEFTRRNAATVHWNKVPYDSLPLIADNFWQHTSFNLP